MNDWTPYQTDYLFLLVGTNPLPNYVAALLLAKDNGTVYLLHSSGAHGTGEVAANLKQAIHNQRPQLRDCFLREIDEADSGRIVQKMNEILNGIHQPSVGLHYTGGTKAMAVHVYRTIEKAFPFGVFSYLDARTLSLIIDSQDSTPTRSIRVRQACNIRLEELVKLHGRPIIASTRDPILPQVCQSLVHLHVNDLKTWRRWCEDNLRRPDDRSKFKGKTDLKAVNLPSDTPLAFVFANFRGQVSLQTLGELASSLDQKVDKLAKWLDGKWLEHYVLHSLKQVVTSCHVADYGMNLEPTSERQGFEFDVAAMCGYQLFALACTTSDEKGLCKHKLFEAYVRTRQMGGDEAHCGLICCYNDSSALQQDVEETWFTEGRVKVFGMADLPNLPARLKEWFETAIDV